MKKIFLIAISLFLFNSIKAQDFKGIIKANPIGFMYSANATYERPISSTSSAFVRMRYYFDQMDYELNGTSFYFPEGTVSLKAGYRYYFLKSKTAPNGLFVAPTASIYFSDSETLFGCGGQFGYQWLLKSRLVIDVYTGVDALFTDKDTFILPVGGVSLGYAF